MITFEPQEGAYYALMLNGLPGHVFVGRYMGTAAVSDSVVAPGTPVYRFVCEGQRQGNLILIKENIAAIERTDLYWPKGCGALLPLGKVKLYFG
jgi:hypothetical protein